MSGEAKRRVGLISDTHGLLRPEAVAFLRDSDLIVHGGDIGREDILGGLATLAPVTAVRGNSDTGLCAGAVRETAVLRVGEVAIYVVHDLGEQELDPAAAGFQVVVSGHSHRPSVVERDGAASPVRDEIRDALAERIRCLRPGGGGMISLPSEIPGEEPCI